MRPLDPRITHPDLVNIHKAFNVGNQLRGRSLFRRQILIAHRDAGFVEAEADELNAREEETRRFTSDFSASFPPVDLSSRVSMITDSIALPREVTGVELQNCYPYLTQLAVQERGLGIVVDCQRSRTALDVPSIIERQPEGMHALLVQVGIVDAAPRVFAPKDVVALRKAQGRAFAQGMIILAGLHRAALIDPENPISYVPQDVFYETLTRIYGSAQDKANRVLALTIAMPSRRGARMNGLPLSSMISKYNDIIIQASSENKARLVDVDKSIWTSKAPLSCFTKDNYHFNAAGHEICAKAVVQALLE